MSSFPTIRLEPSGIEVLNLEPAQNAIRAKYGRSYHRSRDALDEAAALWGFERTSSVGIWSPCDDVLEWRVGRCSAEIRLGRSPSGLWSMTTCYATSIQGQTCAPSIWNPVAFLSRDDARQAGLEYLVETLRGIAARRQSDASIAQKLADMLEADLWQRSLF
ncbi:MAG: hypothetical protein A49_04170 [Methyloceanibacter sp.]|nr:MAG: hypothetical protein A49_04170 [Methyloceanibacter sp.]